MLKRLNGWLGQGLQAGIPAPDFELKDQNGAICSLKNLRGKWVVLYFYPKANTPGCTAQACSFRDSWDLIKSTGAVLWGVSTDDEQTHKTFSDTQSLPFSTLSDKNKSVSRDYSVLLPLGFANRITFIIDPKGVIQKTLRFVNWNTYAETVAEELKPLIASFENRK